MHRRYADRGGAGTGGVNMIMAGAEMRPCQINAKITSHGLTKSMIYVKVKLGLVFRCRPFRLQYMEYGGVIIE